MWKPHYKPLLKFYDFIKLVGQVGSRGKNHYIPTVIYQRSLSIKERVRCLEILGKYTKCIESKIEICTHNNLGSI